MWSRSEAAFRFSAAKLFEVYGEIYFWTFTFRDVMPDWWYANTWSRFVRQLCDLYGGTLHGLKVIELHQSHGIHYHALLNKRVWVGEVRRIAKRYGIGHVDVERADRGSIAYLAKYVSKQFKGERKFFSGCSRWGTVGGFRGVKCKSVVIDSVYHRAIAICQRKLGVKKLPYELVLALGERNTDDPAILEPAMERFAKRRTISGLWGGALPLSRPQREAHLKAIKR